MSWNKTTFITNQTVITAEFLNTLQDELMKCEQKYKTGDKFPSTTYYTTWAGFISSGQTSIQFSIIVPKSMENITTVTYSGNATLRSTMGYIHSKSAINLSDSAYTFTCTKRSNEIIYCNLQKSDGTKWTLPSSTTEITNNLPVIIQLQGQFTFS